MHYDIRVTDKSPKNVIRQMLLHQLGPRDSAGRDATLADWIASGISHHQPFKTYCKRQHWTLAQVLSYLEYQACYLFGGIDETAFTQEWLIFQPIIRDQHLLDRDWTAPVDGRPPTAAAGLGNLEI